MNPLMKVTAKIGNNLACRPIQLCNKWKRKSL